MKICTNCQKPISEKNKFCSKTCAAIFNNKKYPKRKRIKKCKECINYVKSGYTYCENCIAAKQHIKGVPINESRTIESMFYEKGSNRYSHIRYLARRLMKDKPQKCVYCGYSNHVECCHIRDISDFPNTATLGEVNAESNLVLLCPNQHWEFDRGRLIFQDGKFSQIDPVGVAPTTFAL